MNRLLKPFALLGLALTIIPPVLLFLGTTDSLDSTKNVMIGGMILWFAAAIPWLVFSKEELPTSDQDHL